MVAVLYSPSVMPKNHRRTIQELISHAKEHRCLDNEHRCLLLMEFLMHRDTVTRSWGPLLCHSSTTITSCCSMIMHGPMLQASVHNSWKLKTSQFLHGQHTHIVRTLSPRHPSGKDHWNQWSPYNLTLLQLEQTTDSSGRRGTAPPPTEPGFSQGFFSVLSPMEFSFLAAVASGLLSWGHFFPAISSTDCTDTI